MKTKYPQSAFAIISENKGHFRHHSNSVVDGDDNRTVNTRLLKESLGKISGSKLTAMEKSIARSHLVKHARVLLPSYQKYDYNIDNKFDKNKKMFRYFSKEVDANTNAYRFKGNIIMGVEVFRTGVFRNILFDAEYLSSLVDNFHTLHGEDIFRDVPVRIDHPDMLGLRNRMDAVCGYVVDLYIKETGEKIDVQYQVEGKDGEIEVKTTQVEDIRLVADMEITEPDAFEKIKRTTYRNRSVELGAFDDNDGNVYDPVFMGVAWVDIPQVDKLNSLFAKDMKVEELNREDFEKITEDVEEEKTEIIEDGVDETKEERKEVVEEKDEEKEEVVEEKEEEKEEVVEDKEEVVEEKDGEKTEMARELVDEKIEMAKVEYEKLVKENFDFKMQDKIQKFEMLTQEGFGTPAILSIESKLIKSFYANKGSDDYLTPDEQFALLLDMKSSTPKIWEKKDGLLQVDDAQAKELMKKDYNFPEQTNTDDVKEYARKVVANAGLSNKLLNK